MSIEFPTPMVPAEGRAAVFVRYLGFFRETLVAKVSQLPEAELRTSRLPSGWTPLELVKHLRWVELRWIEWGFQGRHVADPWGDRKDDRWHVAPEETAAGLIEELRRQGEVTAAVFTGTELDVAGQPGERWEGQAPATLERIGFHLLQEYARHLGHLDVVVEIAGGPTGE